MSHGTLMRYVEKELSNELKIKYDNLISEKGIDKMTRNELEFILFVNCGLVVESYVTKKNILIDYDPIFKEISRDYKLSMIL